MDEIEKVKKKSKLTGLYVQKKKLIEKLDKLFTQEITVQKEIKTVKTKLAGITTSIEFFEEKKILITTHCIERFRQRIGPVDADEAYIRKILVTNQVENMIRVLGNGTYPVYDSISVIVEDNKLLTVIDNSIPNIKKYEKYKKT
jgi:L-rhamnose isomerase